MASILCVDDDKKCLNSIVERLQAEHYDVDGSESANAAIAAFKRNPFKYEVVITDLDMPGGADGEMLLAQLVELRERRGYDPAPEIICLTGAKSKMNPVLINRIRERGCHYVVKGSDQYVIETQAAIMRLRDMRDKGPTFLFVHGAAEKYKWDDKGQWGCQVGESVNEVLLVHSGGRVRAKLAPTPRRLFDFFARRASTRPLSLEEVANNVALDPFYSYWETGDETVSSESIKNNVRRIRTGLQAVFESINVPFKATEVLSTETYEDTSEPAFGSSQKISRTHLKSTDIKSLLPYSEKTEFYRFKARALVEHVP